MEHWIMAAASVFFVLGGTDYILHNRFGLGAEFEKGILAAGRLLLCMAGFIVLAPVIAALLSPVISPIFRSVGWDPSVFAGLVFANDSGGSVLALEMADDPQMGRYSGLIIGAMMGTTVMFIIPLTIANTHGTKREAAIYGLLAGIITIPPGCLVGGVCAGFPLKQVAWNTVPVVIIALVLVIALIFFRQGVVAALSRLGEWILILSVIGLMIAGFQDLNGIELIPGMGKLDQVYSIVGNICVFLAGIFPLLAVIRRILTRPLLALGRILHVNEPSLTGFLLAFANGIPVCSMLEEMDDRGRMINVAFLVSASCLLGDHLAYTSQADAAMCVPVLVGKLVSGVLAVLLSLVLAPKVLPQKT